MDEDDGILDLLLEAYKAIPERTLLTVFDDAWSKATADVEPSKRKHGTIYKTVRTSAALRTLILPTRLGDAIVYVNNSREVRWCASVKLTASGLIPHGELTMRDIETLLGEDGTYRLNLGERVEFISKHLQSK